MPSFVEGGVDTARKGARGETVARAARRRIQSPVLPRLDEPRLATRVLVSAADPLVRASLRRALEEAAPTAGIDPIAEPANDDPRADVVLRDLGTTRKSVTDGIALIRGEKRPTVALLPDDHFAAEVLGAGAKGVMLRDAAGGALVAALHGVASGLIVIDPHLAPRAVVTRPTGGGEESDDLTPRELEVVQLLAGGLPNKLIADRLGISEHTVKFHVNSILTKLGVQSRTEAVVRAARLGLVML